MYVDLFLDVEKVTSSASATLSSSPRRPPSLRFLGSSERVADVDTDFSDYLDNSDASDDVTLVEPAPSPSSRDTAKQYNFDILGLPEVTSSRKSSGASDSAIDMQQASPVSGASSPVTGAQVQMVVTYDDDDAREVCSLNHCDDEHAFCPTTMTSRGRRSANVFHAATESTSLRARRRLADAQTPSFTRQLPPAVVISDHSRAESDATVARSATTGLIKHVIVSCFVYKLYIVC